MEFGDKIKKLRLENYWTQAYVAKKIGVSDRVLGYYESGNRFPKDKETIRLIADTFNVSVDYLIGTSEQKVKQQSTKKTVPVIGQVQAGYPTFAEEDIIDYEEITESMANSGYDYFGLRIKGDSMEPLFVDGDTVIVRKQDAAENGDVVIAFINGDDATVKRIRKQENGVLLIPENSKYDAMFYSNEQIEQLPVRIIGKCVEVRRKL